MTDTHNIAGQLGRQEIAARLGLSRSAVDVAVGRGKFPAAWFVILREMGREKNIEIPEAVFGWSAKDKSSSVASTEGAA